MKYKRVVIYLRQFNRGQDLVDTPKSFKSLNLDPFFYKGCESTAWVGDGYCDDLTNNEACNFDGGDCCGLNVNRQYCMICQCFKPCKIGNGE